MNQNQTTVLIVKNNEIKDIVIPRWENKFHANGAADVQFTKGYKDGKRVVDIAVQVRDKKTRFQYEGDANDIQLECSRPISLPAFYAIASNKGKFRASKESRSMMMGRFPAYFYKTYAPNGKLYYAFNCKKKNCKDNPNSVVIPDMISKIIEEDEFNKAQ